MTFSFIRRSVGVALVAACATMASGGAVAASLSKSGVVFMYHRFGEDVHPTTNTKLAQLEAHIQELSNGSYRVMGLAEMVDAIRRDSPLPDRAVALSVDDAFLSVYTEAWPRFKAAGLPFTLFVATDAIDKGLPGYMNWDQIRELRDAGVAIGSQTASHPHMPTLSRDAAMAEIARSQDRFKTELGAVPELIAYPYGEASLETMAVAKDAGFVAGFGQHSGVVDPTDPVFYLPRFALNETYGDLTRVHLAANALPLPAIDVLPEDPALTAATNPPTLGFTVPAGIRGLEGLACYGSGQGQLALERLGIPGGDTRIEVRMGTPLPQGRTRINCTMPAANGRWRWFGKQFYVR